jgi:hypothetical protein
MIVEPSLLTDAAFPGRLGAVMSADDPPQALAAWGDPLEPGDERTLFATRLLEATILAENSPANAMSVARAVGAAAASAEGGVLVALVAAGQISGVVMLIASPVSIILVGAGAAYFTWRLMTSGRQRHGHRL